MNIGYEERRTLHSNAKAEIAKACARRIPNDISIFLNEKMTCRVTQLDRKRGRLLRLLLGMTVLPPADLAKLVLYSSW